MTAFTRGSWHIFMALVMVACLCSIVMIAEATDSSDTYEGYLGETINLHGVSYVSNQVYLFFTGQNLPKNGVMLTDTSARADQGQFTIVDVDSDQQWTMKWNTARIANQIDSGTYTVYVVSDPVDRSRLAGHNYKTLSVYLKNPGLSNVRVSVGTGYTLHPEEHSSTGTVTQISATVTPSPLPMTTMTSPLPTQTSATPTRAALQIPTTLIAIISFCGVLFLFRCGSK